MRILLLLMTSLLIAREATSAEPVDYLRDVKPVLADQCLACHGALKQEGGLRLDTARFLLKGGESGAAAVKGKPQDSRIIEAVTGSLDDWRMPPKGDPLEPQQIQHLREWIAAGATAPNDEKPQPDPRDHWAFRKPVRPQLPAVERKGWSLNPVDAFVAAEHDSRGLTPVGEADRATLIRRVFLDLIGLPPSREEFSRWRDDGRPDWYARLVDDLLDRPSYGERQARHWMDIWRYADWSGEENNQIRSSPQHIWRWRDWIVESLNEDKGYDRLIVEMLAGDEIAPDDPSVLRATGYLARNYYKFNRNVWLDDTVEHTAKAFLGLTMNCAKCHDHKYDPIRQKNYYQFRAFFEPHDVRTDPLSGEKDTKKDGLVRVFDAEPETPTFLFYRGDENQPQTDEPLSPQLPDIFGGLIEIPPIGTLEKPVSTGRRLALARWLIGEDNPLTARVAVNHVWLRHFGSSLVNVETDFGLRSPPPRFGGLLDWLAVEFIENGWSLKHLHRVIVTSRTYRLSSSVRRPSEAVDRAEGRPGKAILRRDSVQLDPDNQFLWRQNRRRLEAEVIRDSILSAAGTLDRTRGGREIPLEEGESSRRRSLYFRHGHERQVEFLETFDGASVLECYRRNTTILPQQALALSNSIVSREHSRILASRLSETIGRSPGTDATFIEAAFEQLLSRAPSRAELDRCVTFLQNRATAAKEVPGKDDQEDRPSVPVPPAKSPLQRARESLIHVLLNHNDFVTVR